MKKLIVAFTLGLLIWLGYCLVRGLVIFVHHPVLPDITAQGLGHSQDLAGDSATPVGPDEDPIPEVKEQGSGSWLMRLFRQLSRLFFQYTVPQDICRQVLFFSLSLSVFCAFVLNCYFPEEYRSLEAGEMHLASIQSAIPTLQVLAGALAAATLESFWTHTISTWFYFCSFILWDFLVGRTNARNDIGRQFKVQVVEYLSRIDLPAAVALTVVIVLVFVFGSRFEDTGADMLVAGVLLAQALAALVGVMVVIVHDLRPKTATAPPTGTNGVVWTGTGAGAGATGLGAEPGQPT